MVASLAIAGCASKKTPNSAADLGLSAATPGSAQDFTVNVGDRIFFDTDSSVIRADAQATLSKQAQWLNQYGNYAITVEGHADERGTREYNLALGARRAAATRDFLVVARRRRQAPEDDLLRQGTAGRGVRRHLLLEPEPPRRHRAQRRRQLSAALTASSSEGGREAALFRLRFRSNIWANKIWPNSAALIRATAGRASASAIHRNERSNEIPIHHRQRARPAAAFGNGGDDQRGHGLPRAATRTPRLPIEASACPACSSQSDEAPIVLAQASDPRITQLEEEIRKLSGTVEELNFQVLQMQEQLRKMQEDNEFRFQELEKRGEAGAAANKKTEATQPRRRRHDRRQRPHGRATAPSGP